MHTIIVTGGAGFIGSNFVSRLMAKTDWRVVVVDKLTYAGNRANLADFEDDHRFVFEEKDIADKASIRDVFRQYQPTSLVNLAAESHVDRSIDDPLAFVTTNIVGTYNLLETARHYVAEGGDSKQQTFRFLHVSTDEVYGSLGSDGRFTESTPYAPNSPYAASKAGADHIVRSYFRTYDLPVLLTNCSNNFGPFQFPEKLIPLMILNALEGKDLPIYGDGSNVRDWIFVADHCDGLQTVVEQGDPGEQYNIGAENEKTNLEIIDLILAELERLRPAAENTALGNRGLNDYQQLKSFVTDRPGHDFRYAIDANKIKSELCWQPGVGFDQGMRLTVQWYIDNPDWCRSVLDGTYARERLGLGEPAASGAGSS